MGTDRAGNREWTSPVECRSGARGRADARPTLAGRPALTAGPPGSPGSPFCRPRAVRAAGSHARSVPLPRHAHRVHAALTRPGPLAHSVVVPRAGGAYALRQPRYRPGTGRSRTRTAGVDEVVMSLALLDLGPRPADAPRMEDELFSVDGGLELGGITPEQIPGAGQHAPPEVEERKDVD